MEGRTLDLHIQDVSQWRHPVYGGLTSLFHPLISPFEFALPKMPASFQKGMTGLQAKGLSLLKNDAPSPKSLMDPCSSEQSG